MYPIKIIVEDDAIVEDEVFLVSRASKGGTGQGRRTYAEVARCGWRRQKNKVNKSMVSLLNRGMKNL